ncbi:MAG: arginine--tRNA ligase [Planctomycetaceae bacterium]|jgi:arginyl-tRNA synthetase|nr:arginine--tRNA ligase [Planctomycetaceae bacterium]
MLLQLLKSRFAAALQPLTDDIESSLEMIRPSQDSRFGDFQANMAMPLGKKLGLPPRDVARKIIDGLDTAGLCYEPEIAGPGFINLRIKEELLSDLLQKCLTDTERLGVTVVAPDKRKRIVVDFSAPNVAKEMHVGHIRSTVIGNALQRMLRFYGHDVITDNHIGDWGTPFGMIIYGYRNLLDKAAFDKNPVTELGRIYRKVRGLVDGDGEEAAAVGKAVLDETAKLHHGDPANVELWRLILEHCISEIDRIYSRLNVSFDHTLGESYYNPMLPEIVENLLKDGIAKESDGAIGIFLDGEDEPPMLIRKKDGAFLYGTTDIATIQYRMKNWQPDAILYVVDFRQSLHFKHLFAAARLMGVSESVELTHVKFGTVLGEDNKPFKTRSGDTVGLEGLLDEAEERALAVVVSNDSDNQLSETERHETARRIGIGALIYADLSQSRESDYVFSYNKMLAMNGNTATYMQYAYARVRSIFAKGNVNVETLRGGDSTISLTEPQERALALELLKFDEAIEMSLRDYRPNMLTSYLFDVANRYSTFFDACPVLKAQDEATRTSRLLLCDLTARTIAKGLELLGIETVERM